MSGLLSRRKSSTNARELLCSSNAPIKIVLLGKKGVGKSAIAVRLLTKRFIGEYDPNLEVTLKYVTKLNGEEIVAEIMDTAKDCDDNRIHVLTQWADCFVLVYSIADNDSFNEIVKIKCTIDRIGQNCIKPIVILANKIDLTAARTVSSNSGIEYASEVGCPHYELSARDNYTNIESVFATILEMAIRCSMINNISRYYQMPSQKEYTGSHRDTRERKSSFRTIVKTLTRQKVIKEEIKEENGENLSVKPGREFVLGRARERSNTCNF